MNNLISIIMPVYNAQNYISESIESVLSQSYQNWELVIVNDGSTDRSEQLLLEFKDNRIRYFKKENGGVSSARNLGLDNMRGDFFCFLDADDILTPDSLSIRIEKFNESPDLDIVDGGVAIFDTDTLETLSLFVPSIEGNISSDLCGLTGKSFFGLSWMIRSKGNDELRFKEGLTHGEDLLFFIQLSIHHQYSFVVEPILKYRKGHTSAMSNLKGLEQGYRTVYNEIQKISELSRHEKKLFHQKSRSIMFKSYLGYWKPFAALRVLLTW